MARGEGMNNPACAGCGHVFEDGEPRYGGRWDGQRECAKCSDLRPPPLDLTLAGEKRKAKIRELMDELKALLEGTSGGEWYVEDGERCWELYAENDGVLPDGTKFAGHPLKIAKCPKISKEYAEYWPNEGDTAFIVGVREALPRLLATMEELFPSEAEGGENDRSDR